MILPEIGISGQLKLQNSAVLVIGAGGLGSPILLYLAGAGIGHIGVIDNDTVDESNLHRQVLYHSADIGKLKAEIAIERLGLLNKEIQLTAYSYRLKKENASALFYNYDIIIDGSDNFATRYLVNDVCVALNKPLVFGSIFQFEGQVSVFNYLGGHDYRALYPEEPETSSNCNESGVMGTLPGIIGSIMANEVIKMIVGFGEILSEKLLIYSALNNSSVILNCAKPTKVISKTAKTISSFEEINMDTMKKWKANNIPMQLIDVREPYEFEECNFGGQNIPLYELSSKLNKIATDQPIIIYCTTGKRSKIAAQLLKDQFKNQLYILITS